MAETRRHVRYLLFHEIVENNRTILVATGGLLVPGGNLQNANSLHYLVEAVQAELNDQELYPSLYQKAAVYACNIITRHVFFDGNKRTGIASALQFLELNGCYVARDIYEDEIIAFALGIAKGSIGTLQATQWFTDRWSCPD